MNKIFFKNINIVLIVSLISISIFLLKCNNIDMNKLNNEIDNSIVTTINNDDNSLIIYTIGRYADVNFYTFGGFGYRQKLSQRSIKIVRTFISPDSLKMICWVTITMKPDLECDKEIACNGIAVICFRNRIKQIWKIYPLENHSAICYNSEAEVISTFQTYFYHQFKIHSEYVLNYDSNYGGKILSSGQPSDNGFVLQEYGYNIQDKEFWTKSLIWQKGARIPGLYNFQTKGNVKPSDEEYELVLPKIVYPDSIANKYIK